MDEFITLPSDPSSFAELSHSGNASQFEYIAYSDTLPVDDDRLSGYYGSFCVI
ncbi:hypothetical protein K503DRAFT_776146, partial [Rhizopogon vinicolor AM-OR11-026]